MQSLEIVHFSNCIEEGNDGMVELLDTLLTNASTLKHVDISRNILNKKPAALDNLLDLIIKCNEI